MIAIAYGLCTPLANVLTSPVGKDGDGNGEDGRGRMQRVGDRDSKVREEDVRGRQGRRNLPVGVIFLID